MLVEEVAMPEEVLKERTYSYVLNCQCRSGGFCFYRLEEPNGSDTYYALAVLRMLGKPVSSDATAHYLKKTQKDDGSYNNLYQAFFAVKGLSLIDDIPNLDPRPYIETHVRSFPVRHSKPETMLKRLKLLTELCDELHIEIPTHKHEIMIDFVLSYKNRDGGFGAPYSTLLGTSYAASILSKLKYPVTSLGISKFLRRCESPVHGFLNVPNMAPSFLEHILAGVITAHVLRYTPSFTDACLRLITHCQCSNGGFSRAPKGLPTLQDTYHAILALYKMGKFTL